MVSMPFWKAVCTKCDTDSLKRKMPLYPLFCILHLHLIFSIYIGLYLGHRLMYWKIFPKVTDIFDHLEWQELFHNWVCWCTVKGKWYKVFCHNEMFWFWSKSNEDIHLPLIRNCHSFMKYQIDSILTIGNLLVFILSQ